VEFPVTSPEAAASFERVRGLLLAGGATSGRMMGMPMLFLAGRGFGGLWGDAVTFKLDDEDLALAWASQAPSASIRRGGTAP
jgi:hypothetical protein